ncbi:bifunctional DNA-formamidopyrimidine glycosylase/DNA-(apurinic or apyrimidinic site) lyase [Psychromicrobium lacuslunae]|uniref:Formamidopyrimidine-DNA glycosylase n=1 Tax=Psychromicrobium lacuslunae TaxID=1618207 RepID=A0A0D4BY21_9MICC|nr:bifunctional DNA-formamidopyrimidine glycosylase/DNA-(apurinic or apyrimidinic site) lyase [Psychromicrobium lacuslunae]AJT41233.1 formamidopyrimidine-DNA glycosylase [Psychromicrobium lacuslunae]
MPELPEVEVVRRGLQRWLVGRRIEEVQVLDPRSIRRHALGAEDFRGQLLGTRVESVVRRGKFLWMPLNDPELPAPAVPVALMAHLGMSGQLVLQDAGQADEKHLRVRLRLSGEEPSELRFIDQRIFGGLFVTTLVPTPDGLPGGQSGESDAGGDATTASLIAAEAAHIARDPLDPAFSLPAFRQALKRRKTGLKRALLDQSLISGIGNIYADEALWASKLHYARATENLRTAEVELLVENVKAVMLAALAAGGTSFDSLYVNVNGASGYFERSLNAYGREGEPCRRCEQLGLATLIRRDTFMNRSSYFCPRCQPTPRNGHW